MTSARRPASARGQLSLLKGSRSDDQCMLPYQNKDRLKEELPAQRQEAGAHCSTRSAAIVSGFWLSSSRLDVDVEVCGEGIGL